MIHLYERKRNPLERERISSLWAEGKGAVLWDCSRRRGQATGRGGVAGEHLFTGGIERRVRAAVGLISDDVPLMSKYKYANERIGSSQRGRQSDMGNANHACGVPCLESNLTTAVSPTSAFVHFTLHPHPSLAEVPSHHVPLRHLHSARAEPRHTLLVLPLPHLLPSQSPSVPPRREPFISLCPWRRA